MMNESAEKSTELLSYKRRDVTFDIMKGIGVLLMFIGHIQGIGFFHQIIYSFHMPMFFIIAGYFCKSKCAQDVRMAAVGGVVLSSR